jgi:hypothetical protein
MELCPSGEYNPYTLQSTCFSCPVGYYCPQTDTTTKFICPEGSYCIGGQDAATPCPAGTYGPREGITNVNDCENCPYGKYCGTTGLTTPGSDCNAGYYCGRGSDTATETICPAGYYCPSGTPYPIHCPPGTYNAVTGGTTSANCTPCPDEMYCPDMAMSTTPTSGSNACATGYDCISGARVNIPNDGSTGKLCDLGNNCAICPNGSYNAKFGIPACKPCPAGYYCESKATQDSNSLYYEARPCPVGTYNAFESKSSLSDCVACDAGQYCDEEAMTAPKGDCAAGYFCTTGSPFEKPAFDDAGGNYGMCPTGHHCAANTETPTACLAGTYSAMTKSVDDTNCKSCEPGSYCETAGLSAPTGYCEPGYYCAVGSTSIQAAECTATNYCPQGSANEERCPIGFYNTLAGAGSCVECEAGYTCFNGEKAECPAGFYCP